MTTKPFLLPIFATLLTVGLMAFQARTPKPRLTEPMPVALAELAGYSSQTVGVSEAELRVLPDDTRFLKRVYTSPDGAWFNVSVVIGGSSKSSIHRPELCLPSQGFLMRDPHTVSVAGRDWRFIRLDRNLARPMGFAYTFFNQEDFRTCSHLSRIFRDVWDRSVLNRLDRWVMVTVHSAVANDMSMSEFLERLEPCLNGTVGGVE